MREILFRGKDIIKGQWVEGWYIRYPFSRWPLTDAIIPYEAAENGHFCTVEVDPATIGQCIGLKDKNGKLIFEGDIVRMKGSGISGFGTVEFRNGSFGIADKKRKRFYFLDDHSVYRVDGNIYDNPELLGAK